MGWWGEGVKEKEEKQKCKGLYPECISWCFSPRRVLRVHLQLRAAGSLCTHRDLEKVLLEVIWSSLLKRGLTLKSGHNVHTLSRQIPNISKDKDSTAQTSPWPYARFSVYPLQQEVQNQTQYTRRDFTIFQYWSTIMLLILMAKLLVTKHYIFLRTYCPVCPARYAGSCLQRSFCL